MSGIDIKGARNSRADSADARYRRMVDVANRFSIIQFGFSLFTRNSSGGYESRPYNVFVFPETGQQDVVLSAGAIGFLKEHNMDFQTWLYESVSFVDQKEEIRLRNKFLPGEAGEGSEPNRPDARCDASTCVRSERCTS